MCQSLIRNHALLIFRHVITSYRLLCKFIIINYSLIKYEKLSDLQVEIKRI